MIYKFYHIIFIVITVMIFQHQTFAPWHEQPEKPPENLMKTCEGWIMYHGFKNNLRENVTLALNRERNYDPDVSIWAAGYAGWLAISYQFDPIGVKNFCSINEAPSEVQRHLSLKEAKEDCKFWIILYGLNKRDAFHRSHLIGKRFELEDEYISIWALFYIQYVKINDNNARTSPEQFCTEIGKNTGTDADKIPFMSLHETKLSCQEWIEVAGFTDDVENNYKFLDSLDLIYYGIIFHYWAMQYSIELRRLESPLTFSSQNLYDLQPGNFCQRINCPFKDKSNFYI